MRTKYTYFPPPRKLFSCLFANPRIFPWKFRFWKEMEKKRWKTIRSVRRNLEDPKVILSRNGCFCNNRYIAAYSRLIVTHSWHFRDSLCLRTLLYLCPYVAEELPSVARLQLKPMRAGRFKKLFGKLWKFAHGAKIFSQSSFFADVHKKNRGWQ